jgi:protein-L-isoaspartate(D-aspartate) O-methyltransferase
MIDFAAARRMMVDGQVRTSDVTDLRIIAAMLELPRERFVPESRADLAYLDLDVAVGAAAAGGEARRLLKPMVLAAGAGGSGGRPCARCRRRHRLLVGAAPRLPAGRWSRSSRIRPGQAAQDNLRRGRRRNVTVVTGPLTEGWRPRPLRRHFRERRRRGRPQALAASSRTAAGWSAYIGRADRAPWLTVRSR